MHHASPFTKYVCHFYFEENFSSNAGRSLCLVPPAAEDALWLACMLCLSCESAAADDMAYFMCMIHSMSATDDHGSHCLTVSVLLSQLSGYSALQFLHCICQSRNCEQVELSNATGQCVQHIE